MAHDLKGAQHGQHAAHTAPVDTPPTLDYTLVRSMFRHRHIEEEAGRLTVERCHRNKASSKAGPTRTVLFALSSLFRDHTLEQGS